MQIKLNEKAIYSILLTGSIILSMPSCTGTIIKHKEKSDISSQVMAEADTEILLNNGVYIGKNNVAVNLNVLNNSEYVSISEDNKYTLYTGAHIYFKNGSTITDEIISDNLFTVTALETNGTYTLIELPSGEKAYVDSVSLIKNANLRNSEYIAIKETKIFSSVAYLYNSDGMYKGYVYENTVCHAIAANDEYTLVVFEDGNEAFVLNSAIISESYRQINGYGFIKKQTPVYSNKNLTKLAYNNSYDEVVYIVSVNDQYAEIIDNNTHQTYYVNIANVNKNFILIDLTDQKMDCYLDYQLSSSYPTRSGKNVTPTHEGAFDIDDKIKDFTFTKYPGSHARYWIPINEYEEGIHDLIGDDEQNYGNQAYQLDGSHGCIRVPATASEFVYNNYEVGDMVLVRKK